MIKITLSQQLPNFELSLRGHPPSSAAIHESTTLRARATVGAMLNRALGGASYVRVGLPRPLHLRRRRKRRRGVGGNTRDRACGEIGVASLPLLCHRQRFHRLSAVRADYMPSWWVVLFLRFGAVFTAVLENVFLEVRRGASGDAHAFIVLVGANRRQFRANARSSYRTKRRTKNGAIRS